MPGVGDLLPVFVGDRAVVLAELLADRVHLPAQEVLALLLLRAVFDVVADALAHLQLGEPLSLELQRQLQPLDDVERFEQLELLVEVQVRASSRPCRPARPASVIDRTNARIRPSSPRSSRISSTTARYSRSSSRVSVGAGALVGTRLRRRRAARRRRRRWRAPGIARWSAVSDTARPRPASAHALGHFGDDADVRVGVVVPRHEQHAVVGADVDRQRDRHAREHHRVIEGNDSQPVHSGTMHTAYYLMFVNYCVHQL